MTQLVIGRHHIFIAIFLALFALVIGDVGGEVARAVEVEIARGLVLIELGKLGGVLLWS